MGRGSQKGHEGGKGGRREREPLERTDKLDERYNATPAATSTNATHFIFCLSLFVREFIVPSKEYLEQTECFIKFSKYMSFLLRFGGDVLHQQSLSLTLHELFHFSQFSKHTHYCRTFMESDPHHTFGNPYTPDIANECKKCNINVDSMRWFIPFATVVWCNTKGRIQFTVMNTDLVREPIASEWCTTDMTVDEILMKIKNRDNGSNGGYKTNNVFLRAQSGHGNLRTDQRPGVPYDFRHGILCHKTKVPYWQEMSRSRTERYLKCMGRDIHLVPIQFLLTESEMLRNYGGRVLLFNTNYERTREALRTARETPNGYILVSENIHLGALEACFNLDADTWDFPYTPETTIPRDITEHGLEEAIHILHYYSEVVHRQEMTIGDLPAAHRQVLRDIENHYRRHLRHPGAPGGTEEERTAGDRISLANKMTAEDAAIGEIVREVFKKVQKSRLEAKDMPKNQPVPSTPATSSTTPPPVKEPPKVVLEQRAKEKAEKKHKAPPQKLLDQLQKRPSADTPAKASTEPAVPKTDTTVRLTPRQPKHPPPPKRPSEQAGEAALKKTKQEDVPVPPAARPLKQNKMPTPPSTPQARAIPPAPTRPAPAPPSRAGPIPPDIPTPPRPPVHARSRTPTPPHPPKRAQQPAHPPPGHSRSGPYADVPPPPAPVRPTRSERSDTTDRRQPLPRQRQEEVPETSLPDFDLIFTENASLEEYVNLMNEMSTQAPDPAEERAIRRSIWDRLVELVNRGISTGSRQLDRIISTGIDSVELTDQIYDIDYVPSPEEHFLRQDPGEQGRMFRPRLMIHITDNEWSLDILMKLRDLGRCALAGRAVCRDHVLFNAVDFHNVSTHYFSIAVLNLGNIIRLPWFANRKRYPSEIRNNEERLRENLILPYLVVNNPGHIVTLNESYDFTLFRNLCIEYNLIGVQCFSNKTIHPSPPLSIFVKSSQGMVEVLHHWDASKTTGAKTDGWLLHAVIARCIFGPRSHNVDEYTRERTENRYTGEDITTHSFSAEDRYCTHGIKNVITEEQDLEDPEESYDNLAQGNYFPTSGFTDQYVTRLGLAEIRVLTLHINSDAFRHAINKIRQYLRLIFAKALLAQVDFITGDFNLFCNRQFLSDLGGSVYGGLVMEVLDDAVRSVNTIFEHPVTYNVSSSTPASEVFDFMQHGNTNADIDCMLCISLFYNKQKCSERLPKLIERRELAHDYLHNISERPRQLSNYDLCLGQTDCDWHIPLIVRVHAHYLRNKRTRSGASQQNRQAAAQRRQASSAYGRNTGWYEEERWDAGPYQRHYPGWYGGDQ